MATRNRRARRSDYVSPTCPPGWAWLLAGILIGVFISFLVYLREIAPQMSREDNTLALPSATESQSTTPNKEPFTPDSAVPIFEFDQTPPLADQIPPKAEVNLLEQDFPITVPGRYLLQVGSFQNEQAANGLKAHLSQLGITAHIEKTMLTESGRWHRVQVGPFTDLDRLNQTQALLIKNHISVIARKF